MRLLLTSLLLSFSCIGFSQKDGAKILFINNTIDFDTIDEFSNQSRIFTFYNIGDDTLKISKVTSGCSCTIPSWTKESIPPGGRGEIKATYKAKTIGKFNRPITVYSNAVNGKIKKLTIKGFWFKKRNHLKKLIKSEQN